MTANVSFSVTPSPHGGPDVGPAEPGKAGASRDDGGDAFSQALASLIGAVMVPQSQTQPAAASTPAAQGATPAGFAVVPPTPAPAPANTNDATLAIVAATTPTGTAADPQPGPVAPANPAQRAAPAPPTAAHDQAPAPRAAADVSLPLVSFTATTAALAGGAPPPPPPAAVANDGGQTGGSVASSTAAAQVSLAAPPPLAGPLKAPPAPASSGKSASKPDPSANVLAGAATPTGEAARPVTPPMGPNGQAGQQDGGASHTAADVTPRAGETPTGAEQKTDSAFATSSAVAPTAIQTAPAATGATAAAPIAAQLATQVIKSVEGKSTRFDLTLEPAGLGRVDVRVDIGAAGQVTAQFSFDNAHAAAEARTQAGQLQHALEQAGFNVGQGGLSFDVGGQGASLAGRDAQSQTAQAIASSAPTPLAGDAADAAAPRPSLVRAAGGLDITI
ncbi:MAG TPA: flagellar hook-length control protein FliK [Caulobacteraceae bacterium]|nr:flagellar hook-length control protein FliK [Caulobacteraceae bacterium]